MQGLASETDNFSFEVNVTQVEVNHIGFYKKPNMDIRTPIFVLNNWIVEIAFR